MRTRVNACGLITAKYLGFLGFVQKPANVGGQEMERVRGIEPLYEAWKAAVLPLNYTRAHIDFEVITKSTV